MWTVLDWHWEVSWLKKSDAEQCLQTTDCIQYCCYQVGNWNIWSLLMISPYILVCRRSLPQQGRQAMQWSFLRYLIKNIALYRYVNRFVSSVYWHCSRSWAMIVNCLEWLQTTSFLALSLQHNFFYFVEKKNRSGGCSRFCVLWLQGI